MTTITIAPGPRFGAVRIPASKSQAHRLMICAAIGQAPTTLLFEGGLSNDIAATAVCLTALGAKVEQTAPGELQICPICKAGKAASAPVPMRCGESGSTLRFLLPLAGALGVPTVFHMEGRLPMRPLAPLDDQLRQHGMTLRKEGDRLYCGGQLTPGAYTLPGDVSSQYISGLLMALPLLDGDSTLTITGRVESAAYIAMTEEALRLSGIVLDKSNNAYRIPGGQRAGLPPRCQVEGDYSNAAFFLCSGAMSDRGIIVTGLLPDSAQGDRAVVDILRSFGAEVREDERGIFVKKGALHGIEIDAAPIPDLIPVLSAVACAAQGQTRIRNAGRLRLKESDRLQSTAQMLTALGGEVTELEDGLCICGHATLKGGRVSPAGDHRIAMTAAAAATICSGPVTVEDCRCVDKSYPRFWEDFESLKGERE